MVARLCLMKVTTMHTIPATHKFTLFLLYILLCPAEDAAYGFASISYAKESMKWLNTGT